MLTRTLVNCFLIIESKVNQFIVNQLEIFNMTVVKCIIWSVNWGRFFGQLQMYGRTMGLTTLLD